MSLDRFGNAVIGAIAFIVYCFVLCALIGTPIYLVYTGAGLLGYHRWHTVAGTLCAFAVIVAAFYWIDPE